MDRKNTCVIYARVSRDDQDLQMQLDECRRYAEFRRWRVTKEYTDHGISGTKKTRPALEELMTAARLGHIGTVVVWKLDRFGRNAAQLVSAVDEFSTLNVGFVSMTESFDTNTPMGRAMVVILSAVAQLERDNIAERTKAGLARARRQGKRLGRPKACTPGEVARLAGDGLGPSEIARRLGVGRATVGRRMIEARERNLL